MFVLQIFISIYSYLYLVMVNWWSIQNSLGDSEYIVFTLSQKKVIILETNQSFLKIIELKDGQRACVQTTARVPSFSWRWKFTGRGKQTFQFHVCLFSFLTGNLQQSTILKSWNNPDITRTPGVINNISCKSEYITQPPSLAFGLGLDQWENM